MSPDFIDDLTRWLVSRQTLVLHEDEETLMAEEEPLESGPVVFPPKFHVMGSHPAKMASPAAPERSAIEFSPEEMLYVGVNGRCNKVADTCYTFWVGGSLGVGSYAPLCESKVC